MELKTYFAQDAAGNIISSAIVNIFLQGTTTLATGLTRADGTPLENPFAADGAGRIQFRAPDGYYDVQVSAGSGIIQTLTIQCVDYSGAKADADRAEAAADRAEVSAESAEQSALNISHAIDDVYADFASSEPGKGASLISIGNGRTQKDFNDQFVSPEDYFDPQTMTDWIPAINAALAASRYVQFQNGKTYPCNGIPNFDGHVLKAVDVTLDVPEGVYNYTNSRYLKGIIGNGLKIKAPLAGTYSATAASFSGSAKAWDVTFTMPSTTGIVVGDYVLIRTITDDLYGAWVLGVWKVSSVTSTTITVRNTCHHASPPALTGITAAVIKRIKTQFKFAGCDGFALHAAQLTLDGGQVWVGDWDVAASTGTEGAHAIVVSAPKIIGGASSNAPVIGQGGITTGVDTAIYGWGEQGIAAEQSAAMSINFLVSCANRKRGIYVSTSVGARGKFTITNGNGEDGVICDENGSGAFSLGFSCGNGLNGYWSTNGGFLNATNCKALANLTNGFESRGKSRLAADNTVSAFNTIYGYMVSDGAMMDADTAVADSNGSDGFFAFLGCVFDARNASAKNNGGWGVNPMYAEINFSGSGSFTGNTLGAFNTLGRGTRGYMNNGKFPFIFDQVIGTTGSIALRAGYDATHYADFAATSLGDLVIKNNGVNSFVAKSQGAFYPVQDNATAQTLGRATERWSTIYAGTGTINTSDERDKTEKRNISETEKIIAKRIKDEICAFKFISSVEEKGTDSARWHFGVMAQKIAEIFSDEGLDARKYGLFCYDEWDEQQQEKDEDGDVIVAYRAAGNRYGVRYDQLAMFIISSL